MNLIRNAEAGTGELLDAIEEACDAGWQEELDQILRDREAELRDEQRLCRKEKRRRERHRLARERNKAERNGGKEMFDAEKHTGSQGLSSPFEGWEVEGYGGTDRPGQDWQEPQNGKSTEKKAK